MKVTIQGKGNQVNLTDRDYLTEGGEGKIYLKGSTIYKVHHDRKHMPSEAKIRELQSLSHHTQIICPNEILLDDKNLPIGYTMRAVPKSTHMSRLFTTDFRNRNGIDNDSTLRLVKNMYEVFRSIHHEHCLVVDANENNFLIDDGTFEWAYFIDVCSYQTPSFPATAIMDNIRDYHAKGFTELTDWFSFGVLVCQLFTGIHPFKGTHPKFKRNDFVARMKANISIFNNDVSMPAVVRDIGAIPENYRDWMLREFEKGERMPFPDYAGKIAAVAVAVMLPIETGNFKIEIMDTFSGADIADFFDHNGHQVVIFADRSIRAAKITYPSGGHAPNVTPVLAGVAFTPKTLTPYRVSSFKDAVIIANLKDSKDSDILPLDQNKVMIANNRVYAISQAQLYELSIVEMQHARLIVDRAWPLLPGHTETYDGILAANVLGEPYLIIPAKAGECHFIKFPALKGYRLVNAKYQNHVAMLVGQKGAQFDRFVIRFDAAHQTTDVRVDNNVDTGDINFSVLPNGVVVHIPEDGKVEVFSNDPTSAKTRVIQDPKINSKMRLRTSGHRVVFFTGHELFSLTMR